MVFVNIVDDEDVARFAKEARALAPHIEDVPCFALALALDCGIWSNEKAFKKQSKVRVYSTAELLNLLSGFGIRV